MENLIGFGSYSYVYLKGMSKSSRSITLKCVTFCKFTSSFKLHARKYIRNLQITVENVNFQDTSLELYVKVRFKNVQFVNTTISDRPQALPWRFSELILILEGVNYVGSHIDNQLTAFQFDHVNSLIIEIYDSSLSYLYVKSLVENMWLHGQNVSLYASIILLNSNSLCLATFKNVVIDGNYQKHQDMGQVAFLAKKFAC